MSRRNADSDGIPFTIQKKGQSRRKSNRRRRGRKRGRAPQRVHRNRKVVIERPLQFQPSRSEPVALHALPPHLTQRFPIDCVREILAYLPLSDLLNHAARVNWEWRTVTLQHPLWDNFPFHMCSPSFLLRFVASFGECLAQLRLHDCRFLTDRVFESLLTYFEDGKLTFVDLRNCDGITDAPIMQSEVDAVGLFGQLRKLIVANSGLSVRAVRRLIFPGWMRPQGGRRRGREGQEEVEEVEPQPQPFVVSLEDIDVCRLKFKFSSLFACSSAADPRFTNLRRLKVGDYHKKWTPRDSVSLCSLPVLEDLELENCSSQLIREIIMGTECIDCGFLCRLKRFHFAGSCRIGGRSQNEWISVKLSSSAENRQFLVWINMYDAVPFLEEELLEKAALFVLFPAIIALFNAETGLRTSIVMKRSSVYHGYEIMADAIRNSSGWEKCGHFRNWKEKRAEAISEIGQQRLVGKSKQRRQRGWSDWVDRQCTSLASVEKPKRIRVKASHEVRVSAESVALGSVVSVEWMRCLAQSAYWDVVPAVADEEEGEEFCI